MTSKRQISAIFSVLLSILLMIPENITVFAEDGTESGQNQEDFVLTVDGNEIETGKTDELAGDIGAIVESLESIIEDGDSERATDSMGISNKEYTPEDSVSTNEIVTTDTSESRYEFYPVSGAITYEAAESHCKALGGHLAVISSAEENSLVFSLMKEAGYNNAYFGYTDCENEGEWHWIDGYTSSYVNWAPAEPNCSNSKEDYAMFYSSYSDGTWNDGDFSAHTNGGEAAYICEYGDNDARTVNVSPIWPEPGMKNVYCGSEPLYFVFQYPQNLKIEKININNETISISSQYGSMDVETEEMLDKTENIDNNNNGLIKLMIYDDPQVFQAGAVITVTINEDFFVFEDGTKINPITWSFSISEVTKNDINTFGNTAESTGRPKKKFDFPFETDSMYIIRRICDPLRWDIMLYPQKNNGVCYGTAMTQALLITHRISMSDLTIIPEARNTYSKLSTEENEFWNTLLFYYYLQFSWLFDHSKIQFAELKKGQDSNAFFSSIIRKLKEGEVVPLEFKMKGNGSHIILLFGVNYDGNSYSIDFLDSNQSHICTMNVNLDDKKFHLTTNAGTTSANLYNVEEIFTDMYAVDIEKFYSTLLSIKDNPHMPITVTTGKKVVFKDNTTSIQYNNKTYSNNPDCSGYTDMTLLQSIANDSDSESRIEDYYLIENLGDDFTVVNSSGSDIKFGISENDVLITMNVENADSVDIDVNNEPVVIIRGDDYSFDVTMNSQELVEEIDNVKQNIKGYATSEVLIERNIDDIYVSSEDIITEIETAKWDSEGISNEQLPDSSEVEMLLDTSFILDVHKLIMKPGEEYRITPAKLPDECSPEDIVWSVDNDSVAQVDQDGTVRAIESGTAFVTANIPSLNLSKTVKVVVHSWVSGIELNKNEIDLEIGKTEHLIATVLPDDAANKNVIWTSSDPEYVTVDETGNITAVKVTEEPVIITVRTEEGGFTADCAVTVHEPVNAETLKYGNGFRYLNVGEEKQLGVISEPANSTLIWQSDNESVLTVDSQGIVKAVSEGTATVTVSSGEKRLTFAVTVIPYTIEEWVKDYEHIVDLDNKTVKLKHYDFDYHSDENLDVYNHAIVNGEQFDVSLNYGLWWCRDYSGDYDVRKIDFPDEMVFPKDCYLLFCNLRALTSLNLGKCSTSNTVKMDEMFKNCTALETLDLSSFDTSNVTDMNSMFNNCRSLKSVDLSSFDTSNVVWMNSMFYECGALERLDLGHFNTSNVTDMGYMFAFCSALAELNLSSFDTSKVTRMLAMFESCNALPTVDVSQFDTSSVTDMGYMFAFCNELTELNLSSFDTSEVTSMRSMFVDCKMITKLDLSTFDLSNVTNTSSFLNGANSLSELTGPAVYGNSTISLPRNMYFMKDGMITSAGTLSAESGSGIYLAADSSNINTDENIILDQSQLTIKPGKTAILTASISSPDNNQTVTWISTNPAAATVNSNGLVTGVSEGTATITASVSGCTATCTVTVIDPINIESVSLALKEKIEARFYVYVPDSELNTTDINLTFNGKTTTYHAADITPKTYNKKPCRIVSVDTFAKQMRDDIKVTVTKTGTTDFKYLEYKEAPVTEGLHYKIEDYFKAAEANSTDESLIDLVHKIDNYGKYAQIQFNNYNRESFDEADQIPADYDDSRLTPYLVNNAGSASGIEYTSGSLELESDTGLRVYYKLTGTDAISSYTFKVDGTAATPVKKGTQYYVSIKNIPARLMNKPHTVTVTDKAGNTLTTTYSGLSYPAAVLASDIAPESLKNLCRAIDLYAEAALAYFGE